MSFPGAVEETAGYQVQDIVGTITDSDLVFRNSQFLRKLLFQVKSVRIGIQFYMLARSGQYFMHHG